MKFEIIDTMHTMSFFFENCYQLSMVKKSCVSEGSKLEK